MQIKGYTGHIIFIVRKVIDLIATVLQNHCCNSAIDYCITQEDIAIFVVDNTVREVIIPRKILFLVIVIITWVSKSTLGGGGRGAVGQRFILTDILRIKISRCKTKTFKIEAHHSQDRVADKRGKLTPSAPPQ